MDYEDHDKVINLLQNSQDADEDMRQAARDAHLFTDKRDGQWEPYWWNEVGGTNGSEGDASGIFRQRPRYTFDMTTPIVNQVAGSLEKADFNIQVRPAGGDATKDVAKTIDGLIRNIENISNATKVFNAAARNMITCGFDGWMVRTKYMEEDSFDQDLMIERITNFIDRAWFDDNSLEQDHSDSRWGFLLFPLTLSAYQEQFGDEREDGPPSATSVPQSKQSTAFWRGPKDQVITAEFYYVKEEKKEIVLMTNGQVFEVNDDFKQVEDELEAAGVTRARDSRTVMVPRFWMRKMDGAGWLGEPQKTVFRQIPIVPTYGNFKVFDNKIIYHGVVEKLLDPQRVLNYSKSREIEEGALAPRAKYWMTNKQVAGYEAELQTMNTNNVPVQRYNNDPEVPGPPQQNGGAQINPGLNDISNTMVSMMQQQSGLFDANMGDNPGLQSGIAVEKLQDKGDIGTIHYFSAQEVAICQTAKLLIDAIPEVYDTERQIRVLNEDGSFEMTMLNEIITDEQTLEQITLNDLSIGTYDVTCSAGPAFKNRQDQTLSSMLEIAQWLPETLQQGADIIFNSLDDPGAKLMAERVRLQLFDQGMIPEEQMTEEELEKMEEAAEQEPPPDPMMVAAQAEQAKADAEMAKVQITQQQVELKGQEIQLKGMVESQKLEFEQQKLQLEEYKLMLDGEKMELEGQISQFKELRESDKLDIEMIKQSAETLKILREAMGAESVMSPELARTILEQGRIVSDQQQDL